MPTELSVSPFRIYQQLPIAIEHPVPFQKIFGGGPTAAPAHHYATGMVPAHLQQSQIRAQAQAPAHPIMSMQMPIQMYGHQHQHHPPSQPQTILSGMPSTGPARMDECRPNKSLANGMKNPWAPYTGDTFRPQSVKVAELEQRRALAPYGVSVQDTGDGGGGGVMGGSAPNPGHRRMSISGSIANLEGSMGGGGYGRRQSFSSWTEAGGYDKPLQFHSQSQSQPPGRPQSQVQPQMQRSMSYQPAMNLVQNQDDWDGRNHIGHHPDPGATGRRRSSSFHHMPTPMVINRQDFGHSPSGPGNHVRLTPGLPINLQGRVIHGRMGSGEVRDERVVPPPSLGRNRRGSTLTDGGHHRTVSFSSRTRDLAHGGDIFDANYSVSSKRQDVGSGRRGSVGQTGESCCCGD